MFSSSLLCLCGFSGFASERDIHTDMHIHTDEVNKWSVKNKKQATPLYYYCYHLIRIVQRAKSLTAFCYVIKFTQKPIDRTSLQARKGLL